MRIVFFGTPEFAAYSLEAILEAGHDVAAVVTMPDKPGRRGHVMIESAVKQLAQSKGLKVLQPANLKNESFLEELRELQADLFVVIAFRMLPEAVWAMPPRGTFNLHASLLPRYRGAAPINRAIMNGETRTGVTTFFLKHDIDTGDIIGQREVEIASEDNAGTLHDKLMTVGAEMVLSTLADMDAGKVITYPQPEGEFVAAPKIFKHDCRIQWNDTAVNIHNHVRGLSPYPAAWAEIVLDNGKILQTKIFTTALSDTASENASGTIVIESGRMYGAAGDGKYVEIKSLMPAGKKQMDATAFLAGYKPVKFN